MKLLYTISLLATLLLASTSLRATIITHDYGDPLSVRSNGELSDKALYVNLQTGLVSRQSGDQDGPYILRISYGTTATNPTIGITGLGSESGISGRFVTGVRISPTNVFNTNSILQLEENVSVDAELTGFGYNLHGAWYNDAYGFMGFKLEGGPLDGALGYVEITFAGEETLIQSISFNNVPGEPILTGEKGPVPPEIEINVNDQGQPYVSYTGTLQYSTNLVVWNNVFPDPENVLNPYPILAPNDGKFFRAVNEQTHSK
ncbi:MAG: hypothetical protein ACQKBV_11760 [Puniceicoccales bacterium]